MCRPVPQRLFWDSSTAYGRGRSCSLITVRFPTLLIHFSNVAMFYHYYNWFYTSEVSGLIVNNDVFLRNTRLSKRTHPFAVDWPVHPTIPYGQNSFSKQTIRMWNSLRVEFINFFSSFSFVRKWLKNIIIHSSLLLN